MTVERRVAERKNVQSIEFNELTGVSNYTIIAKAGRIVNASTTGFLMEIHRDQLVPKDLRDTLSLDSLLGTHVALYMPQMNLDLDGTITRTMHLGKGVFAMAIDFSHDVPEYWRACLVDLLPAPGEMEETSD